MIVVTLPPHLRTLAGCGREVTLDVPAPVTVTSILDSLEASYPMLRGTIREYGSMRRRAFVRFFVCEEDVSHDPVDATLPDSIANASEPFMIVGAIAGG